MTGPESEREPAAEPVPESVHGSGPSEVEGRRRRAGRWLRSRRAVPTALVVAALLVAAGTLLYDVVAVRAGGQARPWRRELSEQLATRHLDDPWVLGIAGGAVVLGLLLLWLALARGLRGWLALEPRGAAIHRTAVAALIARRAQHRSDVHSWQVKVGRRRTRVTLTGTTDAAGAERELRAELARIPLAAPHRLDVRTKPVHERHHRRELAELEPPR
ncbi:DUF6286 domain-containing protein [Kitasatospora phosalacinea]|uniref:DUF6286 domain-containing protein n=1 Tax=Kitasatospora phosalacinea TaxID=2065 RepID=A0A9W6PD54_9ACTN|nr:DUF6286 domain-containing protein [Kitasatospora phosalacinea]GLW52756.1 hypothetical protein Kpho01_07670 [Kitasatospora phosalacinea]